MQITCGGKTVTLLLVSGRKPIVEPAVCPCCSAATTRSLRGKDGAVTYCSNSDCSNMKFSKIGHWIGSSKTGVGILDIGDTIIKALWDAKLVQDPADLYTLTEDQLAPLVLSGVKVGKSRAKTILKNIANSKNVRLEVFLGSLGIELLGRRRARILMDAAGGALDNIGAWLDGTLETIQVQSLGDTVRSSVIAGMERNRGLIQKLLSVGVKPVSPSREAAAPPPSSDSVVNGVTFCFTGTRELVEEVQALGGIIKSGVSKGLQYLVQLDANSTSKKTEKAESLGTKVISLDHLREMIEQERGIAGKS